MGVSNFYQDNSYTDHYNADEFLRFTQEREEQTEWQDGIGMDRVEALPISDDPIGRSAQASQYGIPVELLEDSANKGEKGAPWELNTEGTRLMLKVANKWIPVGASAARNLQQRLGIDKKAVDNAKAASDDKNGRFFNSTLKINRDKARIKISDGKIRAINSSDYTILPIPDVFASVDDYLLDVYPDAEFVMSSYTHEATWCQYSLEAYSNTLLSAYSALGGTFTALSGKQGSLVPGLAVFTSDVAQASARVTPCLSLGGATIPLNSKVAIPHLGKNSIQTFMQGLDELMSCFTKGLQSINDLNTVVVKNPFNTAKRVFKEVLELPRRESLEVLEDFQNQGKTIVTAFDLLLVVNEIAQRRIEKDPKNLFECVKLADKVTKAITVRWARHEYAGQYPW